MFDDLPTLRAAILAEFPDLADAQMVMHEGGWDSVAVDIEDRLICKFPRHAGAATSLRRETRLLAAIGPRVDMPIPRMRLVEGFRLFSIHEKLNGEHLVSAQYQDLPEANRQALATALAHFYAQLHAIDLPVMRAAGGLAKPAWPEAGTLFARALPLVPENLRGLTKTTIAAWPDLPTDPQGQIYGFFDGHGWNMAFDHDRGVLNGIYDFGDSGFGSRHQEFIYSGFIDFDLTNRIATAYEVETGLALDRDRIDLLTGIHRIAELAETADEPLHAPLMLAQFIAWAESRPR